MSDAIEAIATGAELAPPLPPDTRRALIALRVETPEQIAAARREEAERMRTDASRLLKASVQAEKRAAGQPRAPVVEDATKPRRRLSMHMGVPRPRIDESVFAEIRAAYAAGGVSQEELAKRFGVGRGSVWRAVHRDA